MTALADRIATALAEGSVPGRAEHQRAYLKTDVEHLGTPVPVVRSIAKKVRRESTLGHDELMALVAELWAEPVHERRLACIELLTVFPDQVDIADVVLLERMLREAGTWALVDPLAIGPVGTLAERTPAMGSVLDRWVVDDDFWVRRSALLALMVPLRRGGGDLDRFFGYADRLLDESEFFIRKAIGWVLRETGRKRPDVVYDWLLPRAERASSVTMREAVKPLTPEQRSLVLAARSS